MNGPSHLFPLAVRFLFAIVCFGLVAPVLHADIAPRPLSGGRSLGHREAENEEVAMEEEFVDITITPTHSTTHVLFKMRNLIENDVTMKVGFPYAYEDDLQHFSVKVNGRTITDIKKEPHSKDRRNRRYWKTWMMTFPSGKLQTVEVRYQNDLREVTGWLVPGGQFSQGSYQYAIARAAASANKPIADETLAYRNVHYILKTGSQWAGPIGRCRIEIRLDGLDMQNVIPGFPYDLIDTNRQTYPPTKTFQTIAWDIRDFEPAGDVVLGMTPNITNAEVVQLVRRLVDESSPGDPLLVSMLIDYLIASGKNDDAQELLGRFLKQWQDNVLIWDPDSVDPQRHRQSKQVLTLVLKLVELDQKGTGALKPRQFTSSIAAICRQVQKQVPFAKDKLRYAQYVNGKLDEALTWCEGN